MRKRIVLQSEPCEPPKKPHIKSSQGWYMRRETIATIAKAQLVGTDDTAPILNIDIFYEGELKARYFADKFANSHRALIINTGEWKQLCLQNVANVASGLRANYNEYSYYCDMVNWDYETKEDRNIVHAYLERDVRYWESEIQSSKRMKALNNKQARIDALMEEAVPDIPEDFYRWMHEDIFGRKHLYQKKLAKMTRCTCAACGKTWLQKKSLGIGWKTCPKCGSTVLGTYKQEIKSAEKSLYLLQPCRKYGQWIERYFRASCVWSPEKESLVSIDERIRVIVPNGKDWGTCYYEDFIDKDGKPTFWDSNHTFCKMASGYLYPGTLSQMKKCWPETLSRSGIEMMAAGGAYFNVNHMITKWHKEPCMEYIIKGGFHRLAAEMLNELYWGTDYKVDMTGENPQEAFRLSADKCNRFRQMNGGQTVLGWLQYEQTMKVKISQANLIEADKHGIRCDEPDVWKILSYVKSPDAFINYLRKQSKMQKCSRRQVISDWVDYLDMAKKQKLNLKNVMFYKPKNLKAAHDACVRYAHQNELKLKADGIRERFPDVERILNDIRDKYTYDGDDFSIVVPADIADIVHEGRCLGHCIDTTDRYFDRIQQHISYLVFLRRSSQKDVPYYTLEIEPGGTIRQQRTTGNNQNKADVKEYTPFIHEWQRVVRERISEEDRKMAEVSRQTRIREYQELRDKQEKVWRGALAGKLLVDVLEADLIEAI